MNNSIIPGSIHQIAKLNGTSIAETFVHADAILIVDTSGSMSAEDSRGGKSRYAVALEELGVLQRSMPGKIAIISFSSDVRFCPGGIAEYLGGGTDMAKALQFTKIADIPKMKFILISDGYPDDAEITLSIARTYINKIDTIYVGPERETNGRDFLIRLAQTSGGKAIKDTFCQELSANVQFLLTAG